MPRLSDLEDLEDLSSNSDTDSDSSGVQSIPDGPPLLPLVQRPISNKPAHSSDFFVTPVHITGRLINNRAKRKAADYEDYYANPDRHPSKTPRLTRARQRQLNQDFNQLSSTHADSSNQLHDDDTNNGDPESNLNAVTSDPGQRRTRQRAVPPPTLHSALPRNALQLIRQVFPQLHVQPKHLPPRLRFVMDLPVRQIPIIRTRNFNDSKPQNVPSYLLQATGEMLPEKDSCSNCIRKSGSYGGVYQGCVVWRDDLVNEVLRGACAGCWYNRMGCKCSLRGAFVLGHKSAVPVPKNKISPVQAAVQIPKPTGLSKTGHKDGLALTSLSTRKETPISRPRNVHAKRAAATKHAAGANRRAAGSSIGESSAWAITAPLQPVKVLNPAKHLSNQRSLKDLIESWTKHYERMPMAELLATHKHLLDWNVECSIHMSAIVDVLFKCRAKVPGDGTSSHKT